MIQRSILRGARIFSTPVRSSSSFWQQTPYVRAQLRQRPARLAASSRWYSGATEAAKNRTTSETGTDGNGASASSAEEGAKATESAEDPLKKELDAKNKDIINLKDQILRSVADYRNLQDRTARDKKAAKDLALREFAADLVDSVDNLDRALTNAPAEALADETNKELINLHSGLKMTETILMQTLKKHGLERFDPSEKQEKFDPKFHEATFQTPQSDKEDGTVFFTQQKGFLLNGRVIRAAKVGVVKNS